MLNLHRRLFKQATLVSVASLGANVHTAMLPCTCPYTKPCCTCVAHTGKENDELLGRGSIVIQADVAGRLGRGEKVTLPLTLSDFKQTTSHAPDELGSKVSSSMGVSQQRRFDGL